MTELLKAVYKIEDNKDVVSEDFWTVVYRDKNGKVQGEKNFTSKDSAQKYANQGNAVDKVGGKYQVHTVKGSMDEDSKVNEAVEDEEPASPDEAGMAKAQLNFIAYAVDEMEEYIDKGVAFPEWFQNKLTGVYTSMQDLHAYMEGENHDEDEEDEDEEDMEEATYHDSGWKKTSGERKDQFGNVVKQKNIAKHLAKKGAAESDPNRKLRSDEKRVNGEIKRESVEEQAPVAPVPGDKWKNQAVMVNTTGGKKQRVVIDRKNIKNYPAKDGWKEVSPGVKESVEEQAPVATEEIKKPSLSQTIMSVVSEKKELSDKQKQLDVDKDGDIEGDDLAKLRARKDKKSEEKKDKQDVDSGKKEPIEMNPKLTEMSDAQMKKREEIVKSMKDKQQYFKDKYGERWKEVMYATATKMATKD